MPQLLQRKQSFERCYWALSWRWPTERTRWTSDELWHGWKGTAKSCFLSLNSLRNDSPCNWIILITNAVLSTKYLISCSKKNISISFCCWQCITWENLFFSNLSLIICLHIWNETRYCFSVVSVTLYYQLHKHYISSEHLRVLLCICDFIT